MCVYEEGRVWVFACAYIVCECEFLHTHRGIVCGRVHAMKVCARACVCAVHRPWHRLLAACLSSSSRVLQRRPQGCTKKAIRLPFVSRLSSAGLAGRRG